MNKKNSASLLEGNKFVIPASFYQTWIMSGGVYMMAGRCPCCGGQGCAVGLGVAVLVGGSIAGLTHGAAAVRKLMNNKNEMVK